MMVVAIVFMLYAVVIAILLMKATDVQPEHRNISLNSALGYVFIVIPLVIYGVSVCAIQPCIGTNFWM